LYADKRIVDIPGFPDGITGDELSQRTYRNAADCIQALKELCAQPGNGDPPMSPD